MPKFPSLRLWFLVAGLALMIVGVQSHAEMGWWGGQAPASAIGDPKQGKPIAEATCAACHGPDGNSTDVRYPKLAGQNGAYLYRQLQAFKSGARKSEIMAETVKGLSDTDMANVASYYSRQTIRSDRGTDAGLSALGEQIYFDGVGSGMVPACVMCHGGSADSEMPMMGMMMDMMANAPAIKGQHAAYIVDQLNRFSSGERQSDVMGDIAAALSDMNKKAVAEYLSSLP